MRYIYSLFILLYTSAIQASSLFNSKAKLWVMGRKNIFSDISQALSKANIQGQKKIWVHCASLGEFEQGRPLIEKLKKQYPAHKVILTFFSPSGYEIRKNYEGADFVFYLPEDTPANARIFMSVINPHAVFFVKYEFWFNYLNELKKRNIPTYLVSGIFRPNQYFFKWYGAWSRKQLICFTHFFVQNESSKNLLNSVGYNNATITGDTRFDRVFEICNNVKPIPHLTDFKNNNKIIVAGSTWKKDEEVLSTLDFKSLNLKLIIAPHEVNEAHIQAIEKLFDGKSDINTLRYSKANEHNIKSTNVLIIDSIGLLSSLYQYGEIAYIGGGFGKGIHNILEAATFGLPVIFGPNFQKFAEAVELIKLQGASPVNNAGELQNQITQLTQTAIYKNASAACKKYISENVGATDKTFSQIKL